MQIRVLTIYKDKKQDIKFKGAELYVTKQSLSNAIELMCNEKFYQEHWGKKPLSPKELASIVDEKFKQLKAIYEKYKDDKVVKIKIFHNSPDSLYNAPHIMGTVTPENSKEHFFACPSTMIDSTKNDFASEIDAFVSMVKKKQ